MKLLKLSFLYITSQRFKRNIHYFKIGAFAFVFLSLLCCERTINNPIDHFSKSERQKLIHSKKILLEEFDILKPGDIIRINDSYIIKDNNNENLYSIVNFETNKVIRGIRKGNGPDELISPSSLQLRDDRICVYDVATKKVSQIQICDTTLRLEEIFEIKSDKRIFMINYLDACVVASGIFGDHWLKTIDKEGRMASSVSFPMFQETKDTPDMALSILYISTHMTNSPDLKRMVSVVQNHGVISYYHNINGLILNEYKQIKYYGPEFSIQQRGGIAFSKDNKVGFCALDCDDEYVYALYSGRTFTEYGTENHHCEHLLVYDWKGNPFKYYTLDIPLFSMKYDKEKNTIYGIGYNPEDVFVEYQL